MDFSPKNFVILLGNLEPTSTHVGGLSAHICPLVPVGFSKCPICQRTKKPPLPPSRSFHSHMSFLQKLMVLIFVWIFSIQGWWWNYIHPACTNPSQHMHPWSHTEAPKHKVGGWCHTGSIASSYTVHWVLSSLCLRRRKWWVEPLLLEGGSAIYFSFRYKNSLANGLVWCWFTQWVYPNTGRKSCKEETNAMISIISVHLS